MSLRKKLFNKISNLSPNSTLQKVKIILRPGKITFDKIIIGAILKIVFKNYTNFKFSNDSYDIGSADYVIDIGHEFEPKNGIFTYSTEKDLTFESISNKIFIFFYHRLLLRYDIVFEKKNNLSSLSYFLHENLIAKNWAINQNYVKRRDIFEELFKNYTQLFGNKNSTFFTAIDIYHSELDMQIRKYMYYFNRYYDSFKNIVYNCNKNFIVFKDEKYFIFVNYYIKKLNSNIEYAVIQDDDGFTIKYLFYRKDLIVEEKLLRKGRISEKEIIFFNDDGLLAKVGSIEAIHALVESK